jgi:N-acetylglucosamine-6-phosphate deacetylase
MPPLHHRGGGAVTAGLCTGAYCELICDGIHIAPDVVRLTYNAKGSNRLVLVTDSMSATGMPDGDYSIAGEACKVVDGIARTLSGALAGSTLDMKRAVENLAEFAGIPLSSALRCATLTPAEAVGIDGEVGSLEPGKRADIIMARINGKKLSFEKIICGGVPADVN